MRLRKKETEYLSIVIYNKFLDEDIVEIMLPANKIKAANGEYSALWKRLRTAIATNEKINKDLIRARIIRFKSLSNDVIILLPSGLKLTFPEDVTDYDLQIIKAQLNVLKMSFNSSN
jgi:hypothetical protein